MEIDVLKVFIAGPPRKLERQPRRLYKEGILHHTMNCKDWNRVTCKTRSSIQGWLGSDRLYMYNEWLKSVMIIYG
jgi:hypothetical protein